MGVKSMPFSASDERWPLLAVLVWIATRSLKMTAAFAEREAEDVFGLIATSRQACGTPLNMDFGSSFHTLLKLIKSGRLIGGATRIQWRVSVEQENWQPEEIIAKSAHHETSAGQLFEPVKYPNSHYPDGYEMGPHDFLILPSGRVIAKGSGADSPDPDGSRRRWSWEDVTFDRDDVLGAWPELQFFVAWKAAKSRTWKPPENLSSKAVAHLSTGTYADLGEVVDLLAFGDVAKPIGLDDLEARTRRLCAGLALLSVAATGAVELCGNATFRLPDSRGGSIAPLAFLERIDPGSLGNMTLVIDGARDWLGPREFADEYPERGIATGSVAYANVIVHLASLQRWVESISSVKPSKKRGPKQQFEWDELKVEVFRLMEIHGDFFEADLEWGRQARLEEKLLEYCSREWRREPGMTQLRKHLGKWLPEWRAARTNGR